MNTKKQQQGFTLLYAVLIVSVVAVITGTIIGSIIKELRISRDEANSLKAFYAADSGIECVRFHQYNYLAFDTDQPITTLNCGIGADFQAGGGDPSGTDCREMTYNFDLEGFSNGACTNVEVKTDPITVYVLGTPYVFCTLHVTSTGRSNCSGGGDVVERTRWEDM